MTATPFVGLDLASSPRKPSAWAVLGNNLELVRIGRLKTDEEILDTVRCLRPEVVAIDAPLSLPLGLCCLEGSCPCRQRLPRPGRMAEHALYGRGISAFPVTKRTFIKELVYRGLSLGQALRDAGYEVIEVYPYATKLSLFGRPVPPKTSARGRAFLAGRLAALVPTLDPIARGLNHHEGDALLAAYTAYLFRQGLTEALGNAEEGFVYVPRQTDDMLALP